MQKADNAFANCAEQFTGFAEQPAQETFLIVSFISGTAAGAAGRDSAVLGFVLLMTGRALKDGIALLDKLAGIVILRGDGLLDLPVMAQSGDSFSFRLLAFRADGDSGTGTGTGGKGAV